MDYKRNLTSLRLKLTKYIFKNVLAMQRKFCHFYSTNIKKCNFFSPQDGKMQVSRKEILKHALFFPDLLTGCLLSLVGHPRNSDFKIND